MAGEGWGGGRKGITYFSGGTDGISRHEQSIRGEKRTLTASELPMRESGGGGGGERAGVRYKKRILQNLMRDWVNFLATQPKSSKANPPPLPTQTINKDMSLSYLKEQT